MSDDHSPSRMHAAGWAVGVATAVAAGLALAFALAVRLAGEQVLLLGARWDAGLAPDVLVSLVVGGLAALGGVVLAVRLRPTQALPWRWLLGAAVLVFPLGAVLELVSALLRGLLGLDAAA